jgi:hypothetical protein
MQYRHQLNINMPTQLNFAKREEFCLKNGDFAAEMGKIYNQASIFLLSLLGADFHGFNEVQGHVESRRSSTYRTSSLLHIHIHFQCRHFTDHCHRPRHQPLYLLVRSLCCLA